MPTEPIAAGRARFEPPEPPPTEQSPAPELTDTKGRPITRRRAKELLRSAAERLALAPRRLAMLLALIHFWGTRGIYPGVKSRLAPRARVSPSTAYECLGDLCALGLVLWTHRRDEHGHNRSSLFWFTEAFFRLAGITPPPPPYSEEWSPQAPKSRHKGDPSSLLDPSSCPGSLDLPEDGDHLRAHATTSAATPVPVFVSNDDDPAFVELARAHAEAHAAKYLPAAQRRGEPYDPRDAGTIRREHRGDVAAELRGLAARGLAFALDRHRHDLTADAIRVELTARIVREYMRQDRRWLREHLHPLGGLWATDENKPRELRALGLRVLEAWCDALDPGKPPDLTATLEEAARHVEAMEAAAARTACAELRARTAAAVAAGELPASLPDLDDQEHDTAAAGELPASLPEPAPRAAVPPRGHRVTAEIRAELERIDAEARERAEHRRARRNRTRHRDRARLATRPRERLALLAALLALAAPLAPLDGREPEPPDEGTTAAPWTAAAAPLLRDARERPARRAPRRRRAPSRRT